MRRALGRRENAERENKPAAIAPIALQAVRRRTLCLRSSALNGGAGAALDCALGVERLPVADLERPRVTRKSSRVAATA